MDHRYAKKDKDNIAKVAEIVNNYLRILNTKQQSKNQSILPRKMEVNWTHIQKPARQASAWNLQGKWKQGRQQNTHRKDIMKVLNATVFIIENKVKDWMTGKLLSMIYASQEMPQPLMTKKKKNYCRICCFIFICL